MSSRSPITTCTGRFDAARIDPRRWPSFERALPRSPPLTSLCPTRDAHEGCRMTLIEEPRPDNLVLSPVKQSGLAEQMKGDSAPRSVHVGTPPCSQPAVRALPVVVGRRDPRELTTEEARPSSTNCNVCRSSTSTSVWRTHDSQGLVLRYAVDHGVGVKFSTNGSGIDAEVAEQLAESDYVDVQISIDGAANQHVAAAKVRSPRPCRRWSTSRPPVRGFQDLGGDDPLQHPAGRRVQGDGRPLRRPAPTGSALPVGPWRRLGRLHPTDQQQRELYHWLMDHPDVLTGDSSSICRRLARRCRTQPVRRWPCRA